MSFASVPPLKWLARRLCIRNIDQLDDFGELRYELVRPILHHIKSPQQLLNIERNCPQIAERDEELWREFIRRDIPNGREKTFEPEDPQSWWKVYNKLMKDEEEKRAESEEQLRRELLDIDFNKEINKTVFVNELGRSPRDRDPRSHARASGFRLDQGGISKKSAPRLATSLKNARTGTDALRIMHRDAGRKARENGLLNATMRKTTPAKAPVPPTTRQVVTAPRTMVMQHMARPSPASRQLVPRVGAHATQGRQPSMRDVDAAIAAAGQTRQGAVTSGAAKAAASQGLQPGTRRTAAPDRRVDAAILAEKEAREARLKAYSSGSKGAMATPSSTPARKTTALLVNDGPRVASPIPAPGLPSASPGSASSPSPPPSFGPKAEEIAKPAAAVRKRKAVSIFIPKKKAKSAG